MPCRFFLTIAVLGSRMAAQQAINGTDLGRQLADPAARQAAIDRIAADGGQEVPLLLRWTTEPPGQVERVQLNVGLADAFGRLKTVAAIPFLTANIGLLRPGWEYQSWLRAATEIEVAFPAVAALIKIGPSASRALMRSWDEGVSQGSRIPIIFAVSQIALENSGNSEDERAFLASVVGEANVERAWAEEGLKSKPR